MVVVFPGYTPVVLSFNLMNGIFECFPLRICEANVLSYCAINAIVCMFLFVLFCYRVKSGNVGHQVNPDIQL